MELIDTHCHLTFEDLAGDIEAVLTRSRQASVTSWITVGTDISHSKRSIDLAEKYENLYAAVGIHPHFAEKVSGDDLKQLRQIAKNNKVVAIGETGLDFHYNFSKQYNQIRLFAEHLKIACELDLPVIIHSRQAFDEVIDILEQFGLGVKRTVFHCFGGSAKQADIILSKGYYISFTGVVTFKNAESVRQAAEIVPLNRMMLETDCPYMSPEPVRKQRINEPALMIYTAEFLACLKQMSLDDFIAAVADTTKDFFSLPDK